MTDEEDALGFEEYWQVIRESLPCVESSVEALYRSLEVLWLRYHYFDDENDPHEEDKKRPFLQTRRDYQKRWVLVLRFWRPNERLPVEFTSEDASHSKAVADLFQRVVEDFAQDLQKRRERIDKIELEVKAMKREEEDLRKLSLALGQYPQEQKNLPLNVPRPYL